jgi:hypothetical protein
MANRRGGVLADLAILAVAFFGATGLAALFGAANFGTALGVGQLAFAAALMFVILRR